MRSIEMSGKTVEDAVQAGLKELGKDSSQVAIDVLEYGSPGLFGMFGKLARVRLVVKEDEDDFDFDMPIFTLDQQPEKKRMPEKKPEPRKPEPEAPRGDAAERPARKAAAPIYEATVSDAVSLLDQLPSEPELKGEAELAEHSQHNRRRGGRGGEGRPDREDAPHFEHRPADRTDAPRGPADRGVAPRGPSDRSNAPRVDRARPNRSDAPRAERGPMDRSDAPRADRGRPNRSDAPREPRRPAEPLVMEDLPPLDLDALSDTGKLAYEFLTNLTRLMNVDVEIRLKETEGQLTAQMIGDTLGVLIGRRGETLDALQYLTSLKLNKDREEYLRVTLDTEHYRAKREEALIRLAERMANRARKTAHRVALEPMNPYERRVLHSALQDHPYVTTHSEGEEPYRRVIITLK